VNLVIQQQSSWSAKLSLQLENIKDQTKLVHQEHFGPLRVQKQFSQDDGSCHIYILHPPGGLVGGDSLTVRIRAGADTHTLITSPSAARAYRCAENALSQSVCQVIDVAENAHLEWLPQETIFYDGARAEIDNQVRLHSSSSFLGWEIQMLGRRASGEHFAKGSIDQSSRIWRAGKLCHRERLRVSGDNQVSAWGLNSASVLGTLVALPSEDGLEPLEDTISRLRTLLSDQCWGVTLRDRTLLVRYMGDSAERCRQGFGQVRQLLVEEAIFNGSTMGHEPRIWKT
jgi:urease accessory protein